MVIEQFLRNILKGRISDRTGRKLRLLYERVASFFTADMVKLSIINKADKWGAHKYAIHYGLHFRRFQTKKIRLLEIGTGGYDDPLKGGQGALLWRSYFRKGQIISLDLFKKDLRDKRITYIQGSQEDEGLLKAIDKKYGPFDLIIYNGSHQNRHMKKSFEILFPLLKDGGIYVIEDLQTSYWPNRGGNSIDLNTQSTIMGFLKTLTDGLNHKEFIKPGYQTSYYD